MNTATLTRPAAVETRGFFASVIATLLCVDLREDLVKHASYGAQGAALRGL